MSTLPFNISTRASGAARASNTSRRLQFSTSRAVRAGGGPLFNLGGLGASREAQYLSKERGIPRTEYSSNIHLIRSSEVDPFAPAPGSTRTAAARNAAAAAAAAAARSQAEEAQAHSRVAFGASSASNAGMAAPGPMGQGATVDITARLQALRGELAATQRVLGRIDVQARRRTRKALVLSTVVCMILGYFIGYNSNERQRVAGTTKPADSLIQAQPLAERVDEAKAQRQRDALPEEQALAESGLTSFEIKPAVLGHHPRTSFLGGLFWART